MLPFMIGGEERRGNQSKITKKNLKQDTTQKDKNESVREGK